MVRDYERNRPNTSAFNVGTNRYWQRSRAGEFHKASWKGYSDPWSIALANRQGQFLGWQDGHPPGASDTDRSVSGSESGQERPNEGQQQHNIAWNRAGQHANPAWSLPDTDSSIMGGIAPWSQSDTPNTSENTSLRDIPSVSGSGHDPLMSDNASVSTLDPSDSVSQRGQLTLPSPPNSTIGSGSDSGITPWGISSDTTALVGPQTPVDTRPGPSRPDMRDPLRGPPHTTDHSNNRVMKNMGTMTDRPKTRASGPPGPHQAVQAGAEAAGAILQGAQNTWSINQHGGIMNNYYAGASGQHGTYVGMHGALAQHAGAEMRAVDKAMNWYSTGGSVAGPIGKLVGGIIGRSKYKGYVEKEKAKINFKNMQNTVGAMIDPSSAMTSTHENSNTRTTSTQTDGEDRNTPNVNTPSNPPPPTSPTSNNPPSNHEEIPMQTFTQTGDSIVGETETRV